MNTQFTRFIGIDVSKALLEISDSDSKLQSQIDNDSDSIQRKLIAKVKEKDRANTLVVCEATGGLELDLVDLLHEAGIAVVIANPFQVRCFAKGHGYLEKNDKIDARIILLFGQQVKLTPAKPRTAEQKRLTALTRRRAQVIDLLIQEKNRLATCHCCETKALIQESINHIEKQLKSIESTLAKLLDQMAKTEPKIAILLSTPGIGYATTAVLLAELPELGMLSRTKIAKLAGLAPLVNQSGTQDNRRSIHGGRSAVRTAMYLPTMSAMRYNQRIKGYADRLRKKGKPHKVIVTACMRKLLTILNLIVKNGTRWDVIKKGDERASSSSPTCSIGT